MSAERNGVQDPPGAVQPGEMVADDPLADETDRPQPQVVIGSRGGRGVLVGGGHGGQ